ncbi:MAG TPA: hypothetical protein VHB46_09145 [Burkholderiales bacterium]|nr:hypothetical protein [Burkholderiales bacterium]
MSAIGRGKLATVWIVLGALVVAIVLVERHDRKVEQKEAVPVRDERLLVPIEIRDVGAIEVASNGALHRFERDANGAWFYHGVHTGNEQQHAHGADPATAAVIENALAGFGRARMEREFPLNMQNDEFGVTRPDIFIMVYRPGQTQPLARYAVGSIAPDKVSRYVLPVGSPKVVTIPQFHIDNLLSLIKTVGNNGQAAPKPKSAS